jgi:hypothetical protein
VKTKQRKLSPVAASVVVGVVAAAVLGAGMFLLVLPQQDKAASITKEIAATEKQIQDARALATQKPAVPIHVADLFRLVKAMPDRLDMPGILLQLNQTASDSGITFNSISPAPASGASGFQTVPITVEFNGNFYDLNDFLFRLRNLVTVRGGKLGASGRLFSVQTIEFAEGSTGFPSIHATLHLNAYVYGTGAPASTVTPAPTTAPTTTGATTTTAPAGTTSTPAPTPPPAVASGATQ